MTISGKGFSIEKALIKGKFKKLIPDIIYEEALKALGMYKIKKKEKKREWRIA